jgi:acetolactate synthase I/II/III large subunit
MIDFDLVAGNIVSLGIESVFGIPGSGATLRLIDALERRGVPFHLTRFEGTGVLMAGTIGRLTGRPGFSLSIKGPGLANAVPGLAASWFEAFPVVHLAEAAPAGAPASAAHKRLDHRTLTAAVSKGMFQLSGNGGGLGPAFECAGAEEPGPVVVELVDSSDAPVLFSQGGPVLKGAGRIIRMVNSSERPVVIAGALAARRGWGPGLSRLGVPVFSTAAAKGVVDEELPHSAGVYTGAGGRLTPEAQLLAEADLVVAFGLTAREVLAARPFSSRSACVSAVNTPGMDGFSFTETAGPGAAEEVMDALSRKQWGVERLGRMKEDLRDRMTQGFLPGRVFELVFGHFHGQARVVMDTGYFCTIGEHAWPARKPEWCLFSGQGRYMGTGLPMALGAAFYDPSVPTVAFLGDGGIGMYPAEALLAVKHGLPVLIVLMSDNAFGSIRTAALGNSLTQSPLTMDGRSWTGFFEAMGMPALRAESAQDVARALSAWKPADGPAFLEIVFDPDKYESMTEGIRR